MLIAYLDEFGHIGPYVSPEHRRFNTHPTFGYGGFVIDASRIRSFGGQFEHHKERMFRREIDESGAHPIPDRQWAVKAALLSDPDQQIHLSPLPPAAGQRVGDINPELARLQRQLKHQ